MLLCYRPTNSVKIKWPDRELNLSLSLVRQLFYRLRYPGPEFYYYCWISTVECSKFEVWWSNYDRRENVAFGSRGVACSMYDLMT